MLNTTALWRHLIFLPKRLDLLSRVPTAVLWENFSLPGLLSLLSRWISAGSPEMFYLVSLEHALSTLAGLAFSTCSGLEWYPLLSKHSSPWSTLLACWWSGFSSQSFFVRERVCIHIFLISEEPETWIKSSTASEKHFLLRPLWKLCASCLLYTLLQTESSWMQMKGKWQPLHEGNGEKSAAPCLWTRCHHSGSGCWNVGLSEALMEGNKIWKWHSMHTAATSGLQHVYFACAGYVEPGCWVIVAAQPHKETCWQTSAEPKLSLSSLGSSQPSCCSMPAFSTHE